MSSAEEHLQAILAETNRRHALWEKMQTAAQDAVTTVTQHARQRGVSGRWLPYGRSSTGFIAITERRHPRLPYFEVHLSGKLACNFLDQPSLLKDAQVHGGYPNLQDDDPVTFLKVAVEQLMADLHEHLQGA